MTDTPVNSRGRRTRRNPAVAPTTNYTPAQALAYVSDTRELRTPVERVLADELARIYDIDEREGNERAHLFIAARPVAEAWAQAGPEARFGLELHVGSRLVEDLDELAEHLGYEINLPAPTMPAHDHLTGGR